MSARLVAIERGGTIPDTVVVLRLDNPPVNALSCALARDLDAAIAEAADDPTIRALVLYGGEKGFAAGADIEEFVDLDPADLSRQGLALERAIDRLATLPKIVIAAVTGYALGGGCELALAADLRISAEDARWGQPEILLGIIPGAGGTQRLTRLVGPGHAKDLILSGRFADADEARMIGLVNTVVPRHEVLPSALALAARYAAGPAVVLAAAKAAIDGGVGLSLEAGLALERALFANLFSTADKQVGIQSFLDRGPGKAVFTSP